MESLPPPRPVSLSPSNSFRRCSIDCAPPSSPEFEFWMVGRNNPARFSTPTLLSADELFSGGVILPLRLLSTTTATPVDTHLQLVSDSVPDRTPDPEPLAEEPLLSSEPMKTQSGSDPPEPDPKPGPVNVPDFEPSPSILSAPAEMRALAASTGLTSSKRWKDIFKKSDQKSSSPASSTGNREKSEKNEKLEIKRKEKKREKKNGGSSGGSSAAELNINLWPFSRSRSAGINAVGSGGSPRSAAAAAAAAGRKVSSAPCSRSNSAGESKSRKWPSSPGRAMSGGVHLGRSSPVWQVRRNGSGRAEKGLVNKDTSVADCSRRDKPSKGNGGGAGSGSGGKNRVLNLNVPMCIGYRQHLSCRREESFTVRGSTGARGGQGGGKGCAGGGGTRGIGSNRGGNLFNLRSLFTKKVY